MKLKQTKTKRCNQTSRSSISDNNANEAVKSETNFLDKTIDVFQPFTPREMTREDARQIIENTTGFFKLLLKWDAVDKRNSKSENEGTHSFRGESKI